MEFIIRVALMFFFIQFVVVMSIMTVALLLARPEVPTLGRKLWQSTLGRRYGFVTQLPSRTLRSMRYLARSKLFGSVN